MTDIEVEEEQAPVAHVTVVYTGPAAPHWDLQVRYGDQKLIDDFWARVTARLLLLPKHDPQFRRNRERVNRDAERELIVCDWDLGDEEGDNNSGGHRAGRSTNGQAPPAAAEQAPAEEPQAEVATDDGETAPEDSSSDTTADDAVADETSSTASETAEGLTDSPDSEDSAEAASSEEE